MIYPTGQNVILEILTSADKLRDDVKKRSGILIDSANTVQGEPNQGVIYAVSPEIDKPEYKIGDIAIFNTKSIFQGFKYDGKKLIGVNHDEIVGILKEAA